VVLPGTTSFQGSHESLCLRAVLSFVFFTLAFLFVDHRMTRSLLVRGTSGPLLGNSVVRSKRKLIALFAQVG